METAPITSAERPSDDAARAVLLVEDSRSIAGILCASIGSLPGIDCELAADYAQAEQLLVERADRFFIAVLDLNLPDAPNGEIIDLVQRHGIPIVVLTGSPDEKKRDAMFARGVADYVVKDSLVGIEYVARLVKRMAFNRHAEVLVVDDSRTFRAYLTTLLEQHGYRTLTAADGAEGLQRLHEHGDIHLVIADYNMPVMDGLSMVAEMRKIRSAEQLAIIAISDSSEPGRVSRFLKGGASDYLKKPFQIEEFYCRVDQNIDMLHAVQEARDAANRDFLTQLYNRRYFFEHAEALHRRARSGEIQLLMAMIDADHFKKINDTFGHQAGDEALVAIATTLRGLVRGSGLVARFGGEEFVCLKVLGTSDDPQQCLDQMRQRVASLELEHAGTPVPLTVSIGATGQLGDNIDQMLATADDAVYQAKHTGRNRVVIA